MSSRLLRSIAGLSLLSGVGLFAQPCLVGYTFTSSPNPVAGTYGCGETVTFCYTVTNWNSTNVNWFHGLEITFGPGWDMTTLVPGPPPATCGGSGGTWGWYNSVTGTATTAIGPQGPGFFFDLDNDGNPGNNFGDFCVGAVNWQFCWTINVLSPPACVNGMSLSVTVNSFGDSETGSWSSAGCGGDQLASNPGPPVIAACAVSAGTGTTLDLCSSSPVANLFPQLGGSPDVGGSWTGPGGAPHSGTFDPAIDLAGDYTYTVISLAPPCQSQAVVSVTLQQQPDAGSDGATTTCASDVPFSLFALLGGTPDAGGVWTAPGGGACTGMFDPAVDVAGSYVYDIIGVAPCLSAQASVTVTVNPSPNAGSDGSITLCSNDAPFSLFTALGGSPDGGGVWSLGGTVVSNSYNPAVDAPGVYAYEVQGIVPCPNSIATVTVTENVLPNAGNDAAASFCETAAAVPFISLLNGTPDAGGTWSDPVGASAGSSLDPSTAISGDYTYTVTGVAPCPNAQSTLTITIADQPSAGLDSNVNLCEGSAPTDLFTELGGSPDAGGSWSDPLGAPCGAVFDPLTSVPGTYTYSIAATSPCVDASASVTVNVSTQPSAGADAMLDVCSTSAAIDMFPLLGPSAQIGGSWTDPYGAPSNGVFTPGISADGGYTYAIIGIAPCATVSATVTVFAIPSSDPGLDGVLSACVTGPVEDLFAALNGAPMAGGTWTAPGGAPNGGTVDPFTASSGLYTYTLPATGPCPATSASVDVTIVPSPDAGGSSAVDLCSSSVAPYAMITGLSGTPDAGGTWTGPNGLGHGPDFVPGTDTPGDYTYTVSAPPPCSSASSTISITEVQAVNAGTGGNASLCENSAPMDPSTWLGGNPTAGGAWTDPTGSSVVSIDPSTATPGYYTYTVQGTAPCPDEQALVLLTIDLLPNAGVDASLTLCDEAPPNALINWLGGATPGGTWNGPAGPATGVFTPGVNIPGAYLYTVTGTGACAAEQDQATVDVAVLPLPAPGFTMSVLEGCAPLQVEFTITDVTGLQSAGWTFGDGATADALVENWHTYTTAGTFSVQLQVTDANGCIGNASIADAITVSEGPGAMFYALPLRVSVTTPTTVVTQVPEPGIQYTWDLDGTIADTSGMFNWTFDPPDIGLHPVCLTATDSLGCANTYCIDILVDDDLTIFVANAFSPNGDGDNDTFRPSVLGVEPGWYEFMVFDRWGMLIFSTEDHLEEWNGAMDNSGDVLPQDVYVWKLKAKDQFTPEKQELIGTVTLVK